MKLCKLCQSEIRDIKFDYCEKCRAKWKSPKDRLFHLKKCQNKEYKQAASKRASEWNKANKEKLRERHSKRMENISYETLLFYGSDSSVPKCVSCGETNIKMLSLDHINNDGKSDHHRHDVLYCKALNLKDKTKYQTLCYNCNWKKHLANLKSKWKYEKVNIRLRKIAHRYKTTCIAHYSNNQNKCCSCGNSDIEVLCLDHINDDGNSHRKEISNGINKGGKKFYVWLIRNNFPSHLQVLCLNCNISKERF